ncbi:CIC11C00000002289 [Sungouiella intermedia]|uniref:Palmitoyltransferase n=1 Tax=Sungouiella intermedia TaxID=45354 RepID=A0A1L0B6A4_9ASCO|nr:CIC11C00000002289 [[Candida] intermedia]
MTGARSSTANIRSASPLGVASLPSVPWIHVLVANWLITDPSYIVSSKKLHNYQVQNDGHSHTVFFLGGRLRFVKLPPISVGVIMVIVASGVLFWIFEASWLWHHINASPVIIYTYLWLLSFLFFVKAACSDPGIVPRNLHLPYNMDQMGTYKPPDEYFNVVSLPYTSNTTFGVSVKYCPTCHIWRLPRMSHCGICNVCVSNHDHHCKFLSNCVGLRNYRHFLWFLLVSVLACVCQAVLCFVHLFHYRTHYSSLSTFSQSASRYPVALLLAIIAILGFVYPFLLLGLHVYLTAYNCTTREYLNYVRPASHGASPYVNVFDTKSIWRNLWLNWIATPQGLSLVNPKQQYVEGDITLEPVPPLAGFTHA